ncbi:G-protein coupled receptor Mth2 [Bicyclus anynana]|uniref:G-protein coupled receptor Mth2 n=1 Tax=Bicyclus anynana TaxID=110368 RepID=A0ABM3LR32_BICAN|nr:G-protein coupled receptor Mth2 [Bicyclus anynana]
MHSTWTNKTLKYSKSLEIKRDLHVIATIIPLNTIINVIKHSFQTGDVFYINSYGDLIKVDHFCIEFGVKDQKTSTEPWLYVCNIDSFDDTDSSTEQERTYVPWLMLLSSIFLAIVLLVYSLLPELRNLAGKILMAYVGSLMIAFILMYSLLGETPNSDDCIKITASVYFFLVSSFCWMNIMSIDIWWTFRGYAKARPIHRRGENFKFFVYCLYGWVLPALMTAGLVVVNNNRRDLAEWIVTPEIPECGCFLQERKKLLYLYTPMTILILSNWVFFLMTAYNIRRLMRGTAVLNSAAAGNPAAHQQQRNRTAVLNSAAAGNPAAHQQQRNRRLMRGTAVLNSAAAGNPAAHQQQRNR